MAAVFSSFNFWTPFLWATIVYWLDYDGLWWKMCWEAS